MTSKRPRLVPAQHRHRLNAPACEFCVQTGGAVLWRDSACRVVLVDDTDYPGFCRVIWNTHVKEMTDLPAAGREHCMRVVLAVELALRKVLKPHKVNLASFGNMTPHLHWHIIPRFRRDAHFPNPVWGARRLLGNRRADPKLPARWRKLLAVELSKLPSIYAQMP